MCLTVLPKIVRKGLLYGQVSSAIQNYDLPVFSRHHEGIHEPGEAQPQEEEDSSSSGGSLQTAYSDLGTNSPGAETRGPQAFAPLARAGNSGAHSSTGKICGIGKYPR